MLAKVALKSMRLLIVFYHSLLHLDLRNVAGATRLIALFVWYINKTVRPRGKRSLLGRSLARGA